MENYTRIESKMSDLITGNNLAIEVSKDHISLEGTFERCVLNLNWFNKRQLLLIAGALEEAAGSKE